MSEPTKSIIKVEWDSECYQESWKAIQSWAPKGMKIVVTHDSLEFKYFGTSCKFDFSEDSLLYCTYHNSSGLNLYANENKYLQAIKTDEQAEQDSVKVLAWELSQEQFEAQLHRFSPNLQSFSLLFSPVINVDGLCRFTKLTYLNLECCTSLKNISALKTLKSLHSMNFFACESLVQFCDLEGWTELETLDLGQCNSLTSIGNLNTLKKLTKLDLAHCTSLAKRCLSR
jgi:hypothetical protein